MTVGSTSAAASRGRPLVVRLLLTATILGSLAVVDIVAASPAAAAPLVGVETRSVTSPSNTATSKTVAVACPDQKVIVGGGGVVTNSIAALKLTRLMPTTDVAPFMPPLPITPAGRDGYVVSAAKDPTAVFTGAWSVTAYVVCATNTGIVNHEIRSASTTASSSAVQAGQVGCRGDSKVLGNGASVELATPGEVGLQIARVSDPGDIARGQAHEDVNGFSGTWHLNIYAICAQGTSNYITEERQSTAPPSEQFKGVEVFCLPPQKRLSAGAVVADDAPAHISLTASFPTPGAGRAIAAENLPFSGDWDFIIARIVCVD